MVEKRSEFSASTTIVLQYCTTGCSPSALMVGPSLQRAVIRIMHSIIYTVLFGERGLGGCRFLEGLHCALNFFFYIGIQEP